MGQLPKIRSKFWPEPDLAGFPKKSPDLPELEPKSGTSVEICYLVNMLSWVLLYLSDIQFQFLYLILFCFL